MPTDTDRPVWFRWYVCGLLLLATTINYMDRVTLANAATRVKSEFSLNNEQYGELESWFGLAFAAGALLFGILADRVNVRWLYPIALTAWSLAGMATGWAGTFFQLLMCRTLLGLFEAGHWPCALKTTAAILPPNQRTMGNSILQSGTSIGAIITPLIMAALLTQDHSSWRFAFQVIGAIGLVWTFFWLGSVRTTDIYPETLQTPEKGLPEKSAAALPQRSIVSLVRRLVVLVCVVIMINACWHLFRVWLPLFLQEGRGYSEKQALYIVSLFYLASDVGCLAAGGGTMLLNRVGLSVDFSRWLVFAIFSLITAVSVVAAYLPAGNLLLLLLMLLAAGSLGQFPCYYALSQEVSKTQQGLVTGSLGTVAWLTSWPLHKFFGRLVDQTQSYDLGLAIAGSLPLAAAVIWLLVWDWGSEKRQFMQDEVKKDSTV